MTSRKTHEEWKRLVSEFKKSGLSIAKFCEGTDIKPGTFTYWIKKFNPEEAKAPKLVKLPLTNIRKPTNPVHIIIDDIKIELPNYLSSDKISKIITAVREVI